MFSAEKKKRQSKSPTTTTSTFSCLEISDNQLSLFFFLMLLMSKKQEKYLKLKTQKENIPVEQRYIVWSKTSYKHIHSLEMINYIIPDINNWKGTLSALCNTLCKSKLNTDTYTPTHPSSWSHTLPCTGHAAVHTDKLELYLKSCRRTTGASINTHTLPHTRR